MNSLNPETRTKKWENKFILPIASNQTSEKDGNFSKPTLFETVLEFFRNTSLHGLKFVGDVTLSIYERGFFLISFIIALSAASHYIWLVYGEWVATPVIIGTNPDSTYINEIPFPAITICNMNQARASKVRNFKNSSVEYEMLRTLCGRNSSPNDVTNATRAWSIFQKFIIDVAQPCSKMFISCRYGATEMNCSNLFHPVITDEGVCCTFNLIATKYMYRNSSVFDPFEEFNPPNITAVNWSPEDGYQSPLPPRFHPRPAAGVGIGMGLSIVLDAQTEDYYCSTTNGAGFKALLHNPAEIPDIANYGFSLQVGHETQVVITPQIADASYLLRNMNRKYRQCIFSNEANLSYYAVYTSRNCELECEARLHMELCHCVQYYMPHISPNVHVCGLRDMKCSDQVRYSSNFSENGVFLCSAKCISPCFELKFSAETFSSDLTHNNFLIKNKQIQAMTEEYTISNIASVHFFYVERAFRSKNKQQFIGLTEFLSDTGGLMGWFLGFGVLSFTEIFYYAFMRPCFTGKRYKKELWNKKSKESKNLVLPLTNIVQKRANRRAFLKRNLAKKFRNEIASHDQNYTYHN